MRCVIEHCLEWGRMGREWKALFPGGKPIFRRSLWLFVRRLINPLRLAAARR